MSPMNPRLMRPIASGVTLPPYSPVAYTRLWAVTTQTSGDIEGTAESDTGYYAVKWWDNTVDVYDSGDPFSKAAAGNPRVFEVYPSDASGDPSGAFEDFDVSGNGLTQLRADNLTLTNSGGNLTGGYQTLSGFWVSGPYFSPTIYATGKLENNLLTAEALDQFYADLNSGTGALFVAENPGIDADDPTIATAKGYTVFGSVPPSTSLLLNFNGALTDSSPNELTVTASGGAAISTAEKKFGSGSLSLDGVDSFATAAGIDFNASSGDWTIEAWIRPDSLEETVPIAVGAPRNFYYEYVYQGGFLYLIVGDGFGNPIYEDRTGSTPPAQTWWHVALVKKDGTYTAYENGQAVASTSSTLANVDLDDVIIGAEPSLSIFPSGYIDDFRIVKNKAIYTANFTPPTSQLEVYP